MIVAGSHGETGQQRDNAMKTRRILGIVTVILGLAATASVADAKSKGGSAGASKSFSSSGLTKSGLPKTIPTRSIRDRRGQEPKTVNVPPKVVPKRCILTPTHCRPYDPYRSPGPGKRPQIQDHR
jgi:hypothetical protein